MNRINVVGISCTGKTTLSRAIAERLQLTHVELDALFWGAGWIPVPTETFRDRVRTALAGDRWVADGGYQVARDLIWANVDTVVWLDYAIGPILARFARRTYRRIRSGEEFWPGTGNRETLGQVLRRDSLLWWILRQHRPKRARMEARLAARPDLRVVRLRSPAETERWLASL
ncbi:MAG: adenylate kinase [Chloroflexota bacterium]|nr:adenylate kinase [Chloroflexota bacterium]